MVFPRPRKAIQLRYFYGFAKKLARRKLKCEDLNKTSIHYFIYLPVVYILMLSVRNHTTIKISTSFLLQKNKKTKIIMPFLKDIIFYICTSIRIESGKHLYSTSIYTYILLVIIFCN